MPQTIQVYELLYILEMHHSAKEVVYIYIDATMVVIEVPVQL